MSTLLRDCPLEGILDGAAVLGVSGIEACGGVIDDALLWIEDDEARRKNGIPDGVSLLDDGCAFGTASAEGTGVIDCESCRVIAEDSERGDPSSALWISDHGVDGPGSRKSDGAADGEEGSL
jgi:hypothetical protein